MLTSDVLVIGAGVSGLTSAVCLAESGHSVRVMADLPPTMTTSAVAGASWGPYMVSDPRVLEWSRQTRITLQAIAQTGSATGVRMVNGLETDIERVEPPRWAVDANDFRLCRAEELPPGYATGWRYTIPIVNMRTYLGYLVDRLAACGVKVQIATVSSFAAVAHTARTIINCTGLGSRELVPDSALYPVRGQLVVVKNNGVDSFFQDNTNGEELTYFLPHGDHVVLGGSAIEHASDMLPDAKMAEAIMKRCAAVEPRLLDAQKIEDRVGLRPTRPAVRTERADVDGLRVIHNYGHGGSGLTLSWGCAEEVRRLID
jgi:D-amino-acid oxidase